MTSGRRVKGLNFSKAVLVNQPFSEAEQDRQDPFVERVTGHYLQVFPWADSGEIKAVKAYLALGRAFRISSIAFSEFLAPFDLTPAHYGIARLLYVADGKRLPMTEISKLMNITTTAVTKQIDWLKRREWVVRVAHPTDRRVTYAQLTPEGEARISVVIPAVLRFSKDLWGDLTEAEQELLIRLLARFRLKVEERYLGSPSPV